MDSTTLLLYFLLLETNVSLDEIMSIQRFTTYVCKTYLSLLRFDSKDFTFTFSQYIFAVFSLLFFLFCFASNAVICHPDNSPNSA